LAHGAVRSGKSVGFNFKWIQEVIEAPDDYPMIMVGRTLGALERNVLFPLRQFVGKSNYKYSRNSKVLHLFGKEIWVEGANNEAAVDRIQGETIGKAYGDEVVLWPESFFKMLMTRLSLEDSQFFGTCNPGNPRHYLKKDYIDREAELDLKSWHFRLKDNPHLPTAYIEALEREYKGLWRKRYILGLWVMAKGAIYTPFDSSVHVISSLPDGPSSEMRIGVDIGFTHPTAFVKLLKFGNLWIVAQEYRKSGLTPPQIISKLLEFIGGARPASVEIPPEEAAIIKMAKAAGIPNVKAAINDVLPGITRTSALFSQQRLCYLKSCEKIQEETEGYVWDTKASERGLDKPIKVDDDLLDACRYVINRVELQQPTTLRPGSVSGPSRWAAASA